MRSTPRPKQAAKHAMKNALKIGEIFDPRRKHKTWKFASQEHYIKDFLTAVPLLAEKFKAIRTELPEKLPNIGTTIGIEIECENIAQLTTQLVFPANWVYKTDGSLRNNGMEFISPANSVYEVLPSLALVLAWIHSGSPDFSWRTSVHVHIDCSSLTVEEFKRFIILYFLFEEALFQFANPARKETNIFCTPITRCDFYAISEFIHAPNDNPIALKNAFDVMSGRIKKYSALNLGHMYDFGTVEFRHLRGTGDPKLFGTWLTILCSLYDAAKTLSSEELFQYVKRLNTTSSYDEFTEHVFGDVKEHLLSPFSSFFLSRGVSLVKEVLYGGSLLKDSPKAPITSGLAQFVRLAHKKNKSDRLQRKVTFTAVST